MFKEKQSIEYIYLTSLKHELHLYYDLNAPPMNMPVV